MAKPSEPKTWRVLRDACAKALENAKDKRLIESDKICVPVEIPLRWPIEDIDSFTKPVGIKKFRWCGIHSNCYRIVIEPYQTLVPDGGNYLHHKDVP